MWLRYQKWFNKRSKQEIDYMLKSGMTEQEMVDKLNKDLEHLNQVNKFFNFPPNQ